MAVTNVQKNDVSTDDSEMRNTTKVFQKHQKQERSLVISSTEEERRKGHQAAGSRISSELEQGASLIFLSFHR
jgi:hypothetical protein